MDLFLVLTVILVALTFEYINGFHDTANAIATVVGTKVLTPRQAIVLAAFTNMLGAFFGLAVAKTISSGLVEARFVTQEVLICALLSAICWNLITWWYGLPSSSSHALIGGLVGAAVAAAVGMTAVQPVLGKDGQPMGAWSAAVKWKEVKLKQEKALAPAPPEVMTALSGGIKTNGTHTLKVGTNRLQVVVFSGRAKLVIEKTKEDKGGLLYKVVIPMVTSPVMGFLCGFLFMGLLYFGLQKFRPLTVNRVFGKLQLASCAYMGFGHGMNDATKCMGIITLALVSASTQGGFEQAPEWLGFLKTTAGSDPFHLTPAETFISWLPNWLQLGYMPAPIDIKSQAVPSWVVVTCALTMAAGTAAGGWRIIATLGHRLVKLQPVHGFAAETTAATVLAVTGSLGMPVSTTHAITTSIMGVGCAKRFSALKLKVVERIIWAWVLTLPITATLAYGMVRLLHFTGLLK